MRPAFLISHTALLCLSLTTAQAFARDPSAGEDVLTMRVDGEIEVGPEGRVTSHSLQTNVTDEIRALIGRKVAEWSFHPPMKDGAPAIAKGKMRITLAAHNHEGNYAVRIENVTFPDAAAQSARGRWELVDMGRKSHRFQAAGAVSMSVRIAPDGRILDAFPSQCSVFAVEPGTSAAKACRYFENFASKRIPGWKATYRAAPGEAMPTVPMTGTLPIFFQQGVHGLNTTSPGRWRIEWRTPYKEAPWHDDTAPRVGVSDVNEDDGFVSDVSGLRLHGEAGGASE